MTQRPKAYIDLIMHTYVNLPLAAAGLIGCLLIGCLLSVARTMLSRGQWQAKYFEAGSDLPYRIEVFLSRAKLDVAVALYLRVGGDDTLKITGPEFEV
jgi:hypothetical protein